MNDRPGDGQNRDVTEPQREAGGASRLRDCPHKIQEGSEEMPIKVPDQLPATNQLRAENIFVMTEKKAMHQDIRPLKLAIMNLMPTKITTETQLLRLLGNSPLQVEIEFIKMESHESKKKNPHTGGFLNDFYYGSRWLMSLGNRLAERILESPQSFITRRSSPIPSPP